MIRGIHHVALCTGNFDRMVKFYCEAFGFVPSTDEARWEKNPDIDRVIGVPGSAARQLMLKAGTCYLEIFEYFAPKGRDDVPLAPQDHGYTHFCVDTTDIAADLKRLKALGMTFAAPEPLDMGSIKAVYGKDPEGRIIELQQASVECPFALEHLPPVAAAK
jgi:catechol 2,3-dioxygenase-like lactoylglutathione lyase family enzyme